MQEKIVNIIAKILEVNKNEIALDLAIGELPEWDSLHHLQIITELENEFSCKLSQEDLMDLEDVSDLISLIKEKIGKC